MSNPPGHYHAQGDPPDTVRYWDGTQWVGDPMPAPPSAPPPPPGAAENSKFGTFGIRFGAALIDGIIGLVVVLVLVGIFFGESDGSGFTATADGGGAILIGLVFWAVYLGILIWQSATPGKLILGLTITQEDGQTRLDPQHAFMRSIPGLLGQIPVIGVLVSLVMVIGSIVGILNDDERRSFYDRIGKTRVVYKNRL